MSSARPRQRSALPRWPPRLGFCPARDLHFPLDCGVVATRLAPDMAKSDVFPRISVVICTRDRPESIGKTLESVAAQDYPDYDVLVVDQSRGDETRRLV